jgi:hypothetical protein
VYASTDTTLHLVTIDTTITPLANPNGLSYFQTFFTMVQAKSA